MRVASGFVTGCVIAVACIAPEPAHAQWKKSTDWLLLCTTLLEVSLGADHKACDEVHQPGTFKPTLDAASLWLQGLGFASPAISASVDVARHYLDENEARQEMQLASEWDPRCEERYCAWLVWELDKAHGQYSPPDASLVIDPFPRDPTVAYREGFGLAEVHELFHAVQHGYPDVTRAWNREMVEWITEGSAAHVERAAGRQLGMSTSGSVWLRTYDQPLHQPPTENRDSPEFKDWEYGSWEFFEFLGDYLGSADGVKYLDHLFRTLAPNQNNGLKAVDAAVSSESTGGLGEAFTEFVAQRLRQPCYFTHLGEWNDLDCAQGPDNEHRFVLSFPDTVLRDHTAADLSANGYHVRLEVPAGAVGLLTIRIPPEHDAEHLHLVVEDQLFNEPTSYHARNEYFELLSPGRHEFLVRVVNAPKNIAEVTSAGGTGGMDFGDAAPIEFTLIRQSARATVSGSENGQLDGVLFSYINPDADPQALANEITPALAKRYADHAGLDESTEQGRRAREQIRAAIAQAQPVPTDSAAAPPPPTAVGRPEQCMAAITLFNDSERAVARLQWEGAGPLLGGDHAVRATYAHGLHASVYGTMKQALQEIALIDNPEAMEDWGAEFTGRTVPGVMDLLRQAMAGAGRGPTSLGRQYDEGEGKLWVAESTGEKVQGAFRFTATGDDGVVFVEGEFTAIPGPIMSRLLRSGCEDFPTPDAQGQVPG